MKFLGLEGIERINGGDLSYGGQRLVDLGIALGSKPQVLLLDEPLAGLAAAERERVSNLVKNIATNIPVLIVEHDIDRVLELLRRRHCHEPGRGADERLPGAGARRRAGCRRSTPARAFRRSSTSAATQPRTTAATVLRFERVNTFYGKSHILNDATLDVRAGEIVALLGRNGAGKSTLLKTLAGPGAGEIRRDPVSRAAISRTSPRPTSPAPASAMCRRAAACSLA